jgi:hypothetical protein
VLPGTTAQSQKASPPEMRTMVCRVVAPVAVACPEVLTDKWANDWCFCGRCGESESSIIRTRRV